MEISAKKLRLLSLWIVSLVVVNLIWSNVSSMTAIQELNDFERDVDELAEIESKIDDASWEDINWD